MPGPERHLAAILSADIAGYSRLMEKEETIRRHVIARWQQEAAG